MFEKIIKLILSLFENRDFKPEINNSNKIENKPTIPKTMEQENPMKQQLSKNFSLNELTKSETAVRLGIDNSPTQEHYNNIVILVNSFLQPLRNKLKKSIRITSCYRSPTLNETIKGSKTSQHCKGEAADFEVTGYDNYELAKYISENMIFDQLILEFYEKGDPNSGWVHCSYKATGNRNQILTAKRVDGVVKYFNGFDV